MVYKNKCEILNQFVAGLKLTLVTLCDIMHLIRLDNNQHKILGWPLSDNSNQEIDRIRLWLMLMSLQQSHLANDGHLLISGNSLQ